MAKGKSKKYFSVFKDKGRVKFATPPVVRHCYFGNKPLKLKRA